MAAPKVATPLQPRQTARSKGKRPRPSDPNTEIDYPPTAIRRTSLKKETVAASINGRGDESNAQRNGMYLAYIDDAFASREKVSDTFFFSFFPNGSSIHEFGWME